MEKDTMLNDIAYKYAHNGNDLDYAEFCQWR